MQIAKTILRYLLYGLGVPVSYVLVSLVLSWISIDRVDPVTDAPHSIYLSTNGVHLYIIMPRKTLHRSFLSKLRHQQNASYFSFGWGDAAFYRQTPTWEDLTFRNAFRALFLKSAALMHVTRYRKKSARWVEIKLSERALEKLNHYLCHSFQTDRDTRQFIFDSKGYTTKDDFYKAKGSYSCFKTSNTWVNSAFKASGLKSCLWTPFDFVLLSKYE